MPWPLSPETATLVVTALGATAAGLAALFTHRAAAAARDGVEASRIASRGDLLARLLARYHSDQMRECLTALGKWRASMDGWTTLPDEQRVFDACVDCERLAEPRRRVSGFFVEGRVLAEYSQVDGPTLADAIGFDGIHLYLDVVDFLDRAHLYRNGLQSTDTKTRHFWEEAIKAFRQGVEYLQERRGVEEAERRRVAILEEQGATSRPEEKWPAEPPLQQAGGRAAPGGTPEAGKDEEST